MSLGTAPEGIRYSNFMFSGYWQPSEKNLIFSKVANTLLGISKKAHSIFHHPVTLPISSETFTRELLHLKRFSGKI
jgi:hypothetical protein